jgi:hypothetical protein
LISYLLEWLRRVSMHIAKPPGQLLRASDAAEEVLIGSCGVVEIHQTLPGCLLETFVKGEPERARATALRRLTNCTGGRNRNSVRLRVIRPLVQEEDVRGRWRVGIRLADGDGEIALSWAWKGRVRVRASVSENLAVLRVSGRPTPLAMQHAETAIRLALAPTRWEATGSAMLRLHSLPVILPFRGRFEVAVPVAERLVGPGALSWSRALALQDAATASSPPVH